MEGALRRRVPRTSGLHRRSAGLKMACMNDAATRIESIRRDWGQRLLILGHHYQRADVLAHVDARGDSLELARLAARHREAERIVFCGVHFMAESADILSAPKQTVYMPEPDAGCPMANMADAEAMERAWQDLGGAAAGWVPIVYVNSTAGVKACCGRYGGSACTSGNAERVMRWALEAGKRVLFLPDEHLGRNTAAALGLPEQRVACYDPRREGGGLSAAERADARVVVWKGFCIVHQAFGPAVIRRVRDQLPGARIIVHPECPRETVQLADANGSTAAIIRYVEDAPDGATIVVGTEQNLVERLAHEQAGRVTVKALAPSLCANMAKTSVASLLHLLEHWPESSRIHVDAATARDARLCLERMLAL